jgi:nucleoid-associated protein YgaU
MPSKYQIWLTYDGEVEKLRLPVLPDPINIKNGSQNKSVSVQGLGEVVIKQDPAATVISFGSFFPASTFPGAQYEIYAPPLLLASKIGTWKKGDKPIHFIVTGTLLNMFCTIEDFPWSERGGDVGAIHYSLTLKEYKEVQARQVKIDHAAQTAILPDETPARPDNRAPLKTYTVVAGDCLWDIAARHLGSGSRYTEIAELNTDLVKNPNLIYPGWVLRLPA